MRFPKHVDVLKFSQCCTGKVILLLAFLCAGFTNAHAIKLSTELEVHLIQGVSTSWKTIPLQNTYSSAIPVCTYRLPSFAVTDPPAVTRIDNITGTSFDLKIQGWENSAATTSDVHCIIAEEGAHKLSDGRVFEAHSVVSDKTSGQYTADGAWSQAILENISAAIVHSYTAPILLGQVMSYNDVRASVFHNTDCDSRVNPAFHTGQADGACVGKHIGMINDDRKPETIGYIVAESGSGTVNNIFYELAIGLDTIAGSNTTGTYTMTRDHNLAILSQGAEDGGNGSWAVLYGADPLPGLQMKLQVDEEVFAGDTSRRHTNEQVFYWAFAAAELTLVKKLVNDDGGTAVLTDFVLTATGPDTITGTSGDLSITDATVHPGTYTLSETTMPGYVASTWSCSGGGSQSGNQIKLSGGEHATCVIVNDDTSKATLTLVKKVSNSKGGGTAVSGDFTLSFDNGAGSSGSGITGDSAVTAVSLAPGNYSLSENSIPGYSLTQIVCDGKDIDGLDGLSLLGGEDVTCVFVNDDKSVDLKVQKTASDYSPNIGDLLTFTLLVTNNGPDTATDLNVVDVIKSGFLYQAASISGGTSSSDSDPSGAGLNWTIASLASGASANLTFQAVVQAP